MWTGLETLTTIDDSVHKLRRQLQEVDEQVQSASRQVVEVQQTKARRYYELAKSRLDRLIDGEISASLDDTDRRIQAMLAAREQELKDLERALVENEQLETRLESQREQQRRRVNEISEALDAAEGRAQQNLQRDAVYVQALEEAKKADAIAREAEEKTEQAESDRAAKGAPYEADPLFMYLWKRRFGTADYKASTFIRFLDGWVARLCRFHEARPNYWMLLEIPMRLKEHASRVREEANAKLERLNEMEKVAAEAEQVPQFAAELQTARDALADLDAQIERVEKAYAELVERRAAFAAGQDESLKRCLDSIARQLEREPLQLLRQHAASTPNPADDALVHDMAELEQRQAELTASLERHRHLFERHLDRVKELEEVRRRFKDHDLDGFGSVFTNEAMILLMLNQFMQGMTGAGDFWGTILGSHRRGYRASNPTFGSGGFGIPMGRGWQMPNFPSSSRRGGGGGMGGGGFRTTGGF